MDVLLSIVTGLGLRLFLEGLQEPLGRLGPVLLGLWEGAAVHLLSNSSSNASTPDHYLAYALRVAVDLYFTANLQRTFVVLLWTALGLLASETVQPSRPKRERRRRTSRSVPPHVRHYQSPTLEPRNTSRSIQGPVVSTPAIRPSRPPSPPSFFLEGESETGSNSPHRHYLPSVFPIGEADSSESPPPKTILLPTPPASLIPDSRIERNNRDISDHRLSTIEEQSSGEEGSRAEYFGVPGGHIGFTRTLGSYAPSVATSVPPLPIPNSTIRYIQTSVSRASPAAELELDDTEGMYAPSVAPLPVPNPGTTYLRSEYRPGTPTDGGDPLQTPQAARWELTDHDDGLTTPPGHPKELSPLVLERNLFPNFGQMIGAEPPTTQPIPEPAPAHDNATTSTKATTVITTTASIAAAAGGSSSIQSQAAPPAVEYPSPPVAPDAPPDPDPDLATVKPEPKSSYPTPVASPSPDPDQPSTKHHQQQQQQLDEAETETETDAASVISSLPARLMYNKAEALRTQARAAEMERLRLVALLNQAANEARVRDVLFLKEDIRVEEVKATKLHERAARRFYEGECWLSLLSLLLVQEEGCVELLPYHAFSVLLFHSPLCFIFATREYILIPSPVHVPAARNASQKPDTVDVHGLRVAEAIRMTEKALRDALTFGYPVVRVIVGKGLHSVNNIPILKETLMRTMNGHRIPCKVDPNNSGVLILTLPSSDS
ncbi:hypothetical protein FPV67DRAFT_1038074 [Lyophyllum atratum]|nr:hypothetical protein FPV67DRAFT_1038074 [Lyophyllum atratum]